VPGGLPARPFLYPIVDAAALRGRSVTEVVRALAEGGAQLAQVRAKGWRDGELLRLAHEAAAAARAAGITLLVNDRADVALLAGARGVHVGQDDLPPSACRAVLGPGALVGLSTHALAEVEAGRHEPVDYLAVGPVFPTRTKGDAHPVAGLELVRRARASWNGPLVAIGGLTPENAASVVDAGADGLAVIAAVMAEHDLAAAVRRFRRALGAPA
jgi:thiamine-phosphate pyrophosphorylase